VARLAFCGLGQMGAPMAGRLLAAGHDVIVWNRSPEKAVSLAERGAKGADSPAEAAVGAEGVLTMLSTPEVVQDVLFRQGLADSMGEGSTLIEMSTIGPDAIGGIRDRLPPSVDMLDAPVFGSIDAAESGSLRIVVGGSDEAYERWAPVLQAMGTSLHVGPLGSGAGIKLVNNGSILAMAVAAGEALALADSLGFSQEVALEVLSQTPIGAIIEWKRAQIESGHYPPRFKLGLARKDEGLVVEAGRRGGLDLSVARAAEAALQGALDLGWEELDYGSVIAFLRGRPAAL
jgi:3-hydroxyisobutyrate dehydrogenase-like beta-hydroxyacid dehydrogenase